MMRAKTGVLSLIGGIIAMVCLIFDSKCACNHAAEAIDLCLKTVIPSLFPMFVLSGLYISRISGKSGIWMKSFERFAHLPGGSGPIFLLGLVGGFPVGAQCIVQATKNNGLSRKDAERMLGFCNNCSPAFLFGILAGLFHEAWIPWAVFLIQAESAVLLAVAWPGCARNQIQFMQKPLTLSDAVLRAVRSMVSVCAWVVLAGVFSGILERWLFPILPSAVPVVINGVMELTGGILGLQKIPDESVRMILSSGFVCFGGICVLMQIQSIAAEAGLSMKICLRQKAMQGLLGTILAILVGKFGLAALIVPIISVLAWKIGVEKSGTTMYNSIQEGGF